MSHELPRPTLVRPRGSAQRSTSNLPRTRIYGGGTKALAARATHSAYRGVRVGNRGGCVADRIAEPKVVSPQSLYSSGVRRRAVESDPASDPATYSASPIVCNDCDELLRAGRRRCRGT